MRRRVVVTGIGLCTPLGVGREATWEALIAGRSGIGPITRFDASQFATRIAGEVRGLDPASFIDRREAKHLDPFVHYAIFAADEAVAHAGLAIDREAEGLPPGSLPDGRYPGDRVGVYIGAGLGGVEHIEKQHSVLREKGPSRMSPYFVPQIIVNIAPGLVSIRTGAKGPNLSIVSACSSGAHSLGEAARAIERGDADAMLAGGTEATVTGLGIGGFNAMRALSTRNDAPERASRPFDRDRDGFVMGEGAGVLVLEEREMARSRGARILAELSGYGLSADAHHMTSPPPEGQGAQRCMRMALRDAAACGVAPADIGYINAHGTSTKQGDVTETIAIKAVFGDHARRLAVSSTKSMTGHLLGAAGGVEAAFAVLAIERGVLPPTINYETPDPDCDLDYVPNEARPATLLAALSNSFGFGGTNATLIFSRPRE
jgi:3-oxoacyl-[acyl-carrier-protein] synthase II